MKDFKVLFVLFVLFCSQGVWAQKWEAPNWKNFSYPVIDFKDKAAGTKGARIYRRIVPEPEAFIQQHALWVAQTLITTDSSKQRSVVLRQNSVKNRKYIR